MDKLSLIAQASAMLQITDAMWLYNLIRFESGFNPLARNVSSGARGLIQIMPSTSASVFNMPVDSLIDKYPDFESQLFYVVVPYLQKYKPFPTMQSLYMAVFFPAARNVPPGTTFRELYNNDSKYAVFEKQNPGILTVQDYINKVNKTAISAPIIIAVLVAGAALLFLKGKNL
jgi:hypothetical protein